MAHLLIRSFCSNQMSNWLKKSKILFFSMFHKGFLFFLNERFAHSLIFGELCEQIDQVAHHKWAMWANCSVRSPKMSDQERFAQVAHQKWANEWIACFFEQIVHSLIFSLRKPMSEFLALLFCIHQFTNLLYFLLRHALQLVSVHD